MTTTYKRHFALTPKIISILSGFGATICHTNKSLKISIDFSKAGASEGLYNTLVDVQTREWDEMKEKEPKPAI